MVTEARTLAFTDLTGDYIIDKSHSWVGFVARHMMVAKVRGRFNEFEGNFTLDGEDPTRSTGEVRIQASSIDTSSEQRDQHLKSGDFLADAEHPVITYSVTGIEGSGNDYKVSGDLTIRGITKPATFDAEIVGFGPDAYGNIRVGFEGSAVVDRHDWNVSWNAPIEAGGVVVADKVTLEFEFSLVKQ